tara:strand:- start:105033 stop:105440 length:408 start_codon:yes stop_codon:yes gene_type:complete
MKIKFSLEKIDEIAKKVLQNSSTKIIIFSGQMGSGKTTLISSISKILGSNSTVSSPTFSIINEYELPNDKIYHFDFYRIKNYTEALDIGFEEYLKSDSWNFIEWPEKIYPLLPKGIIHLKLIFVSSEIRLLEFKT